LHILHGLEECFKSGLKIKIRQITTKQKLTTLLVNELYKYETKAKRQLLVLSISHVFIMLLYLNMVSKQCLLLLE